MPNILIQFTDSAKDDVLGKQLNHNNYQHFAFTDESIRIDFFDFDFSIHTNYIENEDYVICINGYVLFKNHSLNTAEFVLSQLRDNRNFIDSIEGGAFLITIYHKRKQELHFFNDRFGLYPAYYYQNNQDVLISNEPKGILLSNLCRANALNVEAAKTFLNFGFTPSTDLIFSNVKRIEPAQQLSLTKGSLTLSQYHNETWEFSKTSFSTNDLDQMLEVFKQGLSRIREKYSLRSSLSISGGMDSRFIHFNSDTFDTYLTFDKGSDDYNVVIKTLDKHVSHLLSVETAYNKHTIDEINLILNLGDGLNDPVNTQIIRVIDSLKKNAVQSHYDGFAGDAILGGSYLNYKKELLNFLGIPVKYGLNDVEVSGSFNNELLDESFVEKHNLKDHTSSFPVYSDNPRKNYLLTKWYNRGLNWLVLNSSLHSKFYYNFYPFFYYPFFDLYQKYSLDLLSLKKLYMHLFKKMPLDMNQLNDNFHKVPFSWSVNTRILAGASNNYFEKLNIKKSRPITDYQSQFLKNEPIKQFIKESLLNSPLTNKTVINDIFSDPKKLAENRLYLYRLLSLNYMLKRYQDKIDF